MPRAFYLAGGVKHWCRSGYFLSSYQEDLHMSDHYQYEETRELVALVNDAAELVRSKGEAAFDDFRVAGSRWRQEETYIFVLDPKGNMLVHPDPALEGKNELDLKDINGKPIIRGLIDAAMALPGQTGRLVPLPMACSRRAASPLEKQLCPAGDGAVRQPLRCRQRHVQRPHGAGLCRACGERRRRADRDAWRGGVSALP